MDDSRPVETGWGVRGIVVGDTVRRLVGRTIAQQLATAVEGATAPYQYALSTRAGCECIAHALQGLTELNPEATVTSIDGIGAFDLISRESMLTGLLDVTGGGEVLPFVRMFYGTPSEYLWEDDDGEVHKIPQGEGGEQGDPMMPLLYSLGQHRALEAINREMDANQHLMAFLDDIFLVTMPQDVGGAYAIVQEKLWVHFVHQSPRGQDQSLESRRHQTFGMRRVGANRQNSAPISCCVEGFRHSHR